MFYLARHLLGDVRAAIWGRRRRLHLRLQSLACGPGDASRPCLGHRVPAAVRAVLFPGAGTQEPAWLAGAPPSMQALSALSCWYFFFYTLYFLAFHLLSLRLRRASGRAAGCWLRRPCAPGWLRCCCRPGLWPMAVVGLCHRRSIMSATTCSWPTCWRWSPFHPPIFWPAMAAASMPR